MAHRVYLFMLAMTAVCQSGDAVKCSTCQTASYSGQTVGSCDLQSVNTQLDCGSDVTTCDKVDGTLTVTITGASPILYEFVIRNCGTTTAVGCNGDSTTALEEAVGGFGDLSSLFSTIPGADVAYSGEVCTCEGELCNSARATFIDVGGMLLFGTCLVLSATALL